MKPLSIPFLAGLATILALQSLHGGLLSFGLTTDDRLISFDVDSPGSATVIGNVTGASLVDIDFYGPDAELYGITASGSLYIINQTTGVATLDTSPFLIASPLENVTNVDFSPMEDRARIFMTAGGFNGQTENARMVPRLTTPPHNQIVGGIIPDSFFVTAADPFVEYNGVLSASAHTNPGDNAPSTTLYSLDSLNDVLLVHSVAPQLNQVEQVGSTLPIDLVAGNMAFDISTQGIGYITYGDQFRTINFTTGTLGTAFTINSVSGPLSLKGFSVTLVPEPRTSVMLSTMLGGLCLIRRRRRSAL